MLTILRLNRLILTKMRESKRRTKQEKEMIGNCLMMMPLPAKLRKKMPKRFSKMKWKTIKKRVRRKSRQSQRQEVQSQRNQRTKKNLKAIFFQTP